MIALLPALLGAAVLQAQRIQLAASLSELESRVKKDSNDAAAHYNVALAYWNAKRWDDAEKALRTAIQIEPQFAAPYMVLAALPFARRDRLLDEEYEDRVPAEWRPRLEESRSMYRRAVMIDPLVETRIGYVMVPTQRNGPTSLRVLEGEWLGDYFEGIVLYFEGKYQESYDRFQRVVYTINGDRKGSRMWNTLLFWHGMAAAHVTKHEDAVLDFETLLNRYLDVENSSKDSTLQIPLRTNEFRYILAVMKQRAGKFNEALDLYRAALENDAGLYMAHVRMALIFEGNNMWPQAIAERQAAVNTNPDDPSLQLDLGAALARANRLAEAEQALQQAATSNPRDSRSIFYLGRVEQQLGKTADAKAAYVRFLSLAPSRYAAQINDAKQRLETLH